MSKDLEDRELMIDSYNVITGISTFEELLETKDELAIVFNPYKPIKVMDGDAYDLLIDYFITTEEYEKCEVLLHSKEINKIIN